MKLQEIEHAIANLDSQDLARFRQWFKKFEDNAKTAELSRLKGQMQGIAQKTTQRDARIFERIRGIEGSYGRTPQRLMKNSEIFTRSFF